MRYGYIVRIKNIHFVMSVCMTPLINIPHSRTQLDNMLRFSHQCSVMHDNVCIVIGKHFRLNISISSIFNTSCLRREFYNVRIFKI